VGLVWRSRVQFGADGQTDALRGESMSQGQGCGSEKQGLIGIKKIGIISKIQEDILEKTVFSIF
jgi:hypothetical protein